jgi:hypothetical protein
VEVGRSFQILYRVVATGVAMGRHNSIVPCLASSLLFTHLTDHSHRPLPTAEDLKPLLDNPSDKRIAVAVASPLSQPSNPLPPDLTPLSVCANQRRHPPPD